MNPTMVAANQLAACAEGMLARPARAGGADAAVPSRVIGGGWTPKELPAAPGQTFRGRVSYIYPAADPATGNLFLAEVCAEALGRIGTPEAGLEADVVTLALAYDVDEISRKAGLIAKDWQTLFQPKLNIAWLPPDQVFLRVRSRTEASDARVLIERYPRLAPYRGRMLYAVNQDFGTMTTELHDGDEIAFIPPVSGG